MIKSKKDNQLKMFDENRIDVDLRGITDLREREYRIAIAEAKAAGKQERAGKLLLELSLYVRMKQREGG